METEPSKIYTIRDSDHAVETYSELNEEGEVEISTVPPTLLMFTATYKGCKLRGWVMSLVATGEERDHAV